MPEGFDFKVDFEITQRLIGKTLVYKQWSVTVHENNVKYSEIVILPSAFLQPVNSTKNSILNQVMKLISSTIFFFFFGFETGFLFLKKVFHSIDLFFFLFGLYTYKRT